MDTRLRFLRFVAYSIETIVFFILQGTPQLMPEIFGSKPCLLLPVALTIAVFESETVAMSLGFVCGLLTDIGYTGKVGFYTVALTILCFCIGYCARNFFVTNLLNASIIGIVSIAVLLTIHFLFNIVSADVANAGIYYVKHYISRILYTGAFFVPLYFFNRLFCSTMKDI